MVILNQKCMILIIEKSKRRDVIWYPYKSCLYIFWHCHPYFILQFFLLVSDLGTFLDAASVSAESRCRGGVVRRECADTELNEAVDLVMVREFTIG